MYKYEIRFSTEDVENFEVIATNSGGMKHMYDIARFKLRLDSRDGVDQYGSLFVDGIFWGRMSLRGGSVILTRGSDCKQCVLRSIIGK